MTNKEMKRVVIDVQLVSLRAKLKAIKEFYLNPTLTEDYVFTLAQIEALENEWS